MAQGVGVRIINQQVHVPIGPHPIEARWFITGNIEVLLSIEGNAIRQAGQVLEKDFLASRRPIGANGDFADPVREGLDDIELVSARRERHPVGEMHGLSVPESTLPTQYIESPHAWSRCFLIVTVRDIEAVSRRVHHRKVRNADEALRAPSSEGFKLARRGIETKHGCVLQIATIQISVRVKGDAQRKASGGGDQFDLRAVSPDAIDLSMFSATPDVAFGVYRHALRVSQAWFAKGTVKEQRGAFKWEKRIHDRTPWFFGAICWCLLSIAGRIRTSGSAHC